MKREGILAAIITASALSFVPVAHANPVHLILSGSGIGSSLMLSYAPDTITGDPAGASLITNVTGTFSDSNIGLQNATITGLIATNPNPGNAPFATSLSHLAVLDPNGLLPALDNDALSYSNLFYLLGAPDTCFDGITGGYLDVFGMLMTLSNGDAVDVWSNGGGPNNSNIYGIAVASYSNGSYTVADYVGGGVTLHVPEPGSLAMLGMGLVLMMGFGWRRRHA